MYKLLFGLFVSILVSLTLYSQPKGIPDSTELRRQFKAQTETWKQAYNSKDAQNLVPLYSPDAEYISSHVVGLVAKGRDKLIGNFQNGMSSGGHIDAIEILSMTFSCDLATLVCRYEATNSGVTVVGRNLLVLKKIDGKWLIVTHMTVV